MKVELAMQYLLIFKAMELLQIVASKVATKIKAMELFKQLTKMNIQKMMASKLGDSLIELYTLIKKMKLRITICLALLPSWQKKHHHLHHNSDLKNAQERNVWLSK